MELLIEIFKQTPWWVFALFAGLLLIGLKAVQPRVITVKKLWLLPLVFTIWNLVWLYERVQGHYSLIVFWFLGLAFGGFFGWLLIRRWKIKAVSRNWIALPGTWSTLILILSVFIVRYFFVFNYETHPEAAHHLFLSDALISGIITGIFIGRAAGLLLKYKKIARG